MFSQGVTSLHDYVTFHQLEPIVFENIFTAVNDDLIKVLKSMIVLNPASRCTCSQALQMPYFSNDPVPTRPHLLPQPKSNNFEPELELPVKRAKLDRNISHVKRLDFGDWILVALWQEKIIINTSIWTWLYIENGACGGVYKGGYYSQNHWIRCVGKKRSLSS